MLLADDGRPSGVTWNYTRKEILADGAVHVVGVALGVAGAIAIVVIAALSPLSLLERAGVTIYAAGLVSMLGVSATYNMWPVSRRKWLLRRADHALIYLMIAGTYTPLVALVGDGLPAWSLLGTVWLVAAIGIALKLLLQQPFQTFTNPPNKHHQNAWLRNCWLHLRRLRLRSGCLQLRQINSHSHTSA